MPHDEAMLIAIMGEQMPDSLAQSREAADAATIVNALQRGMAVLGAELAATTPAQAVAGLPAALAVTTASRYPARSRTSRRVRPWLLTAAAAVVTGVALASAYALSTPAPSDTESSRSLPGVVACAEMIATGNVTAVVRRGDRYAVTLDSVRYLKSERSTKVLTVRDAQLPLGGASAPPVKGEQAMIVVHDSAKGNVDLFTGPDIDSEWAWMSKALPDSTSIDLSECKGN